MATLIGSLPAGHRGSKRIPATQSGLGRRAPRAGTRGLLSAVLEQIYVWQARAEERQALAGLDERLLRDIGLTREDALREVDKPVWRA